MNGIMEVKKETAIVPEDQTKSDPDKLDQNNALSNGDDADEGSILDRQEEDGSTLPELGNEPKRLSGQGTEKNQILDSDEGENATGGFSPKRGPRVYTDLDLEQNLPNRYSDDLTASYTVTEDNSSTSKKYRNRRVKFGQGKEGENPNGQQSKNVFSTSGLSGPYAYQENPNDEVSPNIVQSGEIAVDLDESHQYWIGANGLPLPIINGQVIKCSKKGPRLKKGNHHSHTHSHTSTKGGNPEHGHSHTGHGHHKHEAQDPHKHKHRHHDTSLDFLRIGQLGLDGKPIASVDHLEDSKTRLCIDIPDGSYRGFSVKVDKWGNVIADNPVVLDPHGPPLLLIKYTSFPHSQQQGNNNAALDGKPFIEHSEYLPFWIVDPQGKLIALHDKNGELWDRYHRPYKPTGSGKEPNGDLYDYYLFSGIETPCDDGNSVCFHPEILDSEEDDDEANDIKPVVLEKREAHHTLDIDKIKKMFKHHHSDLDEKAEKPLFKSFQFPNCLKDGSYQSYMESLIEYKCLKPVGNKQSTTNPIAKK